MKKNIVFIFGETGAGKSSLIKFLTNKFGYSYLPLGKLCRKKFTEKFFSECKNPGAPKASDSFVYKETLKFINMYLQKGSNNVTLIDGMPRKPKQVEWVFENLIFGKRDFKVSFLYVTCDKGIREKRLTSRDGGNDGKMTLNHSRLIDEVNNNYSTLIKLLEMGTTFNNGDLNFRSIDTSENNERYWNELNWGYFLCQEESREDSISNMLKQNDKFSDITFKKSKVPTSMDELYNSALGVNEITRYSKNSTWIQNFIGRAIEELNEALAEFPISWKPGYQDVKLDRIRVELIDAWHFMLSAITALGMDSEMFTKTYFQKLEVNIGRWVDSTTKLKKIEGDDSHIGKF